MATRVANYLASTKLLDLSRRNQIWWTPVFGSRSSTPAPLLAARLYSSTMSCSGLGTADSQAQDKLAALPPMEAIMAKLPKLNLEEVLSLQKRVLAMLYFCLKDNQTYAKDKNLPTNASTLMKDGTIQVLEVTDDPYRHHPFRHYNRISAEIEMKIKGIEGAVCLSYVKNRHTNKEIFTIKIYHTDDDDDGYYVRLDIKNQKGHDTADEYVSKQILKQLHEALGIPECQKREMIYLLFYPYMSNEHMTILTT